MAAPVLHLQQLYIVSQDKHYKTDLESLEKCVTEIILDLRSPYLSSSKKKDLANFLIDSSKVGYGKSRQQVKSIAACGAHDKSRLQLDKVLSDGWYYRFMSRQSGLALCKVIPLPTLERTV